MVDVLAPSAVAAVVIAASVIGLSTLLSGAADRRAVPLVALFLLAGLALAGLGVLPDGSAAVTTIVVTAVVAVMLFAGALDLEYRDVFRAWRFHARASVAGAAVPLIVSTAVAGWVLELSWPLAVVLAAAVTAPDAVSARLLLRRPRLPDAVRAVFRAERALIDPLLAAVVLIASAVLAWRSEVRMLAAEVVDVVLLGPVIGGLVGLVAVVALELARARAGIRSDHETPFGLAILGSAAVAAHALEASVWTAAFAAGTVVATLNGSLRDRLRDRLAGFVEVVQLGAVFWLGATLDWRNDSLLPAVAFAAVALAVRPLAMATVFSRLERDSRLLLASFPPRGAATLLLVLVPAATGGAERLIAPALLVVLASQAVHAVALAVWQRKLGRRAIERSPELVTISEYRDLVGAREEVRLLDVRAPRVYERADLTAAGAVRVDPDRPVESAAALALPRHAWLLAYCA